MNLPATSAPPPGRGVYCNRTLNLRTIHAIGYDMDYTLIHYDAERWEAAAFQHLRRKLADQGWPMDELRFDPASIIRGLVIDRALGNLVKANRFGYVKQAAHGTRMLRFDEQRDVYARTVVELSEGRFAFMNTLFSLSEAAMYAQLVDRLDAGRLPEVLGYDELHQRVVTAINAAHMEGELKAEIMARPERFVMPDPELALTLRDQKAAGKQLLLITNSEWFYTRFMMTYALDPWLPPGQTWRDLFDFVIVAARKPGFFSQDAPLLHVVDEAGLLSPDLPLDPRGQVFFGGSARRVEALLGVNGNEILYVGDHIYADVHVSKSVRRWRTALVLRELEDEIAAEDAFAPQRLSIETLMDRKVGLERAYDQLRLARLRQRHGYGDADLPARDLTHRINATRAELAALDDRIGPLARAASELHNPRWGPLLRTGNDKSYLTRQLERHADAYMSRVSNLLYATPFAYLRSARGNLPHDAEAAGAR